MSAGAEPAPPKAASAVNRRAFALGCAMVLLGSLVAVALRSFAEAAFLGAYGAKQMPWLLVANAGGFAVATLGYDAITRRARAGIVDAVLLVVLGALAAGAPALLDAGAPPVVLVVGLAAASQVAGLALWNRVAASVAGRDARRMLPRAGAAVTAGGAIAGLGAGALIPRLGLASIPYLGAAATVLVLGVSVAQQRALRAGGEPGGVAVAAPSPDALSAVQRRLVGALVVVAVLEAIVTTVIDLQFIGTVKARYAGDAVAIALALFYGGFNAILFVLQIAAVPRLLVTRSLPFTAAIHPIVVIASYAGFAASPGFLGIAGTRTADQVLRLATSRTSQEIALSTLPPAPRARWKVLLRGVWWPAGAAATALVLLAIGPTAPARLAVWAIAVAVGWALFARIGARRFQSALVAPLGIHQLSREDPRRIELETLERWVQIAGAPDARTAALARAALARARVDSGDLGDHLRHDAPEVRAAMFDQLAHDPVTSLVGELRAAIAIEDDDHALAIGIKALARVSDDSGVVRGLARPGLSREVDDAVALARLLVGGSTRRDDVLAELGPLCETDPRWAVQVVRGRHTADDPALTKVLRDAAAVPSRRAGALFVIACVPSAGSLPILAEALETADPAAPIAIATIDAAGARRLAPLVGAMSPLARAAAARALAGAPAGSEPIAALVDDPDPEVAYAALRTALAVARGGGALPAARIAAAHDAAVAALGAPLDARAAGAAGSSCARDELDIATRRCVARALWAAAVETAAAGRDPAPLAAVARHLTGTREADRKRALDVVQELQARRQLLDAIERWLRPPAVYHDVTHDVSQRDTSSNVSTLLGNFDPWLGRLIAGELAALEPTLAVLRRPVLFGSIAGGALAALASAATRRAVGHELFRVGEPGDAMYVVTAGSLMATRPGAPARRIDVGGVVGELAVLTHAARAATVTAEPGGAEVLAIDRAAFATAARRAPELVLGLSATLAGWLAPNRPDVL